MPLKKKRFIDPQIADKNNLYYQNTRNQQKGYFNTISLEEYEALRLYYYQENNQKECAELLHVSQPTFSRILNNGIKKIVNALVEDKDFQVSGGNIKYKEWFGYVCWECNEEWRTEIKPTECPNCHSQKIVALKKQIKSWE